MTGWAKYRALQSQKPVCIAAEMKPLCPAASSGSSVVFGRWESSEEKRVSQVAPSSVRTQPLPCRRGRPHPGPWEPFHAALTAVPW